MSDVADTKFINSVESKDPKRWKSVRLHEVADRRSESVDPKKSDLARHVGLEHIESDNPVPRYERLDSQSSTKRRFQAGDVLFAKLRPYLRKAAQADFEGACTSEIIPIVAGDDVNSKFLLYRLSSKEAFDYAIRTSIGTRMPRTSWKLFRNLELALPPLDEQRRIASVLLTVDRAIQTTEAVIAQAKRVKRGLMQSLFTQGIDEGPTKNVRLSAIDAIIPQSWEVVTIEEVTRKITDGAHLTPERAEDGYLLLSARNVKNGYLDLTDVDYVPEREYQRLIKKCHPEPRDVLISCSGTVGRVCLVPENLEFAMVRSAALLKLNKSIVPEFAEQVLQSSAVQKQIKGYQTQSAQPNLFQGQIAQIEIPLPPKKEQETIAKMLRELDEAVREEKRYKPHLDRLKKGLMQDLLTGRVRTTSKNIDVLDEVQAHG